MPAFEIISAIINALVSGGLLFGIAVYITAHWMF